MLILLLFPARLCPPFASPVACFCCLWLYFCHSVLPGMVASFVFFA